MSRVKETTRIHELKLERPVISLLEEGCGIAEVRKFILLKYDVELTRGELQYFRDTYASEVSDALKNQQVARQAMSLRAEGLLADSAWILGIQSKRS